MQNTYQFISDKGVFSLPGAADYSDLYFPVAGECGIKSAVTPTLGGDCKLDQNTFLLEPVSVENLHNNRNARNFWCHIGTHGSWSATGNSAEEIAKKFTDLADENEVTAGFMWQTVTRTSRKYQLSAQITSFVPLDDPMEIMYVEITNTGNMQVRFTPTAAIPVYGRSADNLRDHRHVTSLLHRIRTVENGVLVTPTMSFDERGHRPNEMTYFVCGYDQTGEAPEDFYPTVQHHVENFGELAEKLSGYTGQCVVSFIDLYEKTRRNFPSVRSVGKEEQERLIAAFSEIAVKQTGSILPASRMSAPQRSAPSDSVFRSLSSSPPSAIFSAAAVPRFSQSAAAAEIPKKPVRS